MQYRKAVFYGDVVDMEVGRLNAVDVMGVAVVNARLVVGVAVAVGLGVQVR